MSDGITEGLDQQHFGGMEEEEGTEKKPVCPASCKSICVCMCGYCVKPLSEPAKDGTNFM